MARIISALSSVAILSAMLTAAFVVTEAQPIRKPATDRILGDSELFAGFLVAFEAHKAYWKGKGIDISPAELIKRHTRIACVKDEEGYIVVTFFPEQLLQAGGDVSYFVDSRVLKVVRTEYGK